MGVLRNAVSLGRGESVPGWRRPAMIELHKSIRPQSSFQQVCDGRVPGLILCTVDCRAGGVIPTGITHSAVTLNNSIWQTIAMYLKFNQYKLKSVEFLIPPSLIGIARQTCRRQSKRIPAGPVRISSSATGQKPTKTKVSGLR